MTNNLKTNKYQSNEAIQNEPMFDTNRFNLSSGTSDTLPVVTVYLWVGNKHRATAIAGIKWMRDSEATESTIKKKNTKHYERKMRSNKVEYTTDADVYCMAHDVKVPFCMPGFSSSKIINHCFHVENNKGK